MEQSAGTAAAAQVAAAWQILPVTVSATHHEVAAPAAGVAQTQMPAAARTAASQQRVTAPAAAGAA